MPLTIDNAVSIGVPDFTNSSPTGAIANIPTRNCSNSTYDDNCYYNQNNCPKCSKHIYKKFINNGLYTCTISYLGWDIHW